MTGSGHFKWVVLALLAMALPIACGKNASSVSDAIREGEQISDVISLLPKDDSSRGGSSPETLEDQIGTSLSGPEKILLQRTDTGAWREWSDEWIRLELPDDPLLTVEPVEPRQAPQLQVVGTAVGTTDNQFERAYRITFGDHRPYGLVLVSKNDWFDEGICMCGEVVWRSFLCADGNLLELSFLRSGAVKKAQTISDTHRAVLFEWTHSAITQEAYTRIAGSLRLKQPSTKNALDWHNLTLEKRGAEAVYGWLRPGMDRETVVSILGKPTRSDGEVLVYHREERMADGSGWSITRRFPFQEAKLTRLQENWMEEGELVPLKGSSAWALEILAKMEDGKGEVPEQEIRRVFSSFVRQTSLSGNEWDVWCRVISELAKAGYRDPESLALVERRFLEPDLPGHHARWVLQNSESKQLHPLSLKRIEFLLGDQATPEQRSSELGNLFTTLKKDDEAATGFIRRALRHSDAMARRDAAWSIHRLPRQEAVTALRTLLSDSDEWVRSAAAMSADEVFVISDLEWLEAVNERETDKSVRKYLTKSIETIRKRGE